MYLLFLRLHLYSHLFITEFCHRLYLITKFYDFLDLHAKWSLSSKIVHKHLVKILINKSKQQIKT